MQLKPKNVGPLDTNELFFFIPPFIPLTFDNNVTRNLVSHRRRLLTSSDLSNDSPVGVDRGR